ncbi:ammonium transporter [Listeria monocytogenes]|uniref:ammonium transporter n=1 Tax=Listeria monocytogenes TaxID=1639 RepID=UPI00027E843A|nr:ammonium transporter [Listeria monocytogenes]EAC5161868.1 ammonium transporter [Listeria monocytogenes]EAG8885895.1 ammonium transporter [Listeria monocytogenes]EAG9413572.1 ammonium transporter [Listeria monocytogenes]EFQ7891182.1 ammonium transporter [Listeria monocytogenes]EHX3164730.1 ammonium transporter [Listeria monocytogenes]
MESVFMFFCTLLVWLMTPGIALFYGGMVRRKNVLSTAMYSFSSMAIISILWVIVGYSLAFAPGNGFIGSFDWTFLHNVGFAANATYSDAIPHVLFMMFQMTFAILTVAIISGAFAERMNFSAYLILIILWSLLVYSPVAHWVWGDGGWLRNLGALDFAGGNVVHISSGVTGLVLAIMIGRRKEADSASPHNLPLALIGGILVWFGWYGFNVGSALTIDNVAMTAFVNTNTAAAAGIIGWGLVEWLTNKKPTMLGTISGAIAGLVSITPAAGFVTVPSSLIIGFFGGALCFWAVFWLKGKVKYDDALDAFGLHGIGGIWGGIATGLFATTKVNEAGADGLFYGNASLVVKQLIAIGSTVAYVAVVTALIVVIIKLFLPIRVNEEQEYKGLDLTLHGEKAYQE